MFKDRKEAGSLLARRLSNYKNKKEFVVLGIPRGGIVVAKEVSQKLNIPLNVLVIRKIGAPHHSEMAIGAVGENGALYIDEDLISRMSLDKGIVEKESESKRKEVREKVKLFRKKTEPLKIEGKKVIVVDDGVATGSTIKVAIECLRKMHPDKIILAIPVCPVDTAKMLERLVDRFVSLELPEEFYAVGNFYESFPQVSDKEVVNLLK